MRESLAKGVVSLDQSAISATYCRAVLLGSASNFVAKQRVFEGNQEIDRAESPESQRPCPQPGVDKGKGAVERAPFKAVRPSMATSSDVVDLVLKQVDVVHGVCTTPENGGARQSTRDEVTGAAPVHWRSVWRSVAEAYGKKALSIGSLSSKATALTRSPGPCC